MSGDWEVPWKLFEALDREFSFTLDVCANPVNCKCDQFYSDNALNLPWPGVVWCNPPHGRKSAFLWLQKARQETRLLGSTVVCLVPAKTDTVWWHEDIMDKAGEVRFLRGRLRCELPGKIGRSPFAMAVAIFYPREQKTIYCSMGSAGETQAAGANMLKGDKIERVQTLQCR
jgi:site-specific DNA-methyltransferase (adenine-specific)